MDIRVLNYFLVVAREKNITKAAQLLHLTQPTLSRQLNALEKELNVTLFNRLLKGIELTEEGQLFRRRAQEIVALSEKTVTELEQATSTVMGEIIIGCNDNQGMIELSPRISKFRQCYPHVTFKIISGDNIDLSIDLEEGKIDFALFTEPVQLAGFRYSRLKQKTTWGVLAHESSELGQQSSVKVEDLLELPLITISDETIHNELSTWSGAKASQMRPIAHYNLLANVIPLVLQQDGVAICSKPLAHYNHLNFVPFEPKLEMGMILAWKSEQHFSKAVSAFLNYLEDPAN